MSSCLPARSFNAFSTNKHSPAPASRLEDKSWSCHPRRMTPTGVPSLTSGSEVGVAIHNHRPEPLRLHTGQTVGTLEIVAIADSPPPPPPSSPHRQPFVPAHLSPTHQQQLKALFQEFSDIFSQGWTIWAVLRCSSTPSRLRDFCSASRIATKTPLFIERRWPRSNLCCLMASSVPSTVPGYRQLSW